MMGMLWVVLFVALTGAQLGQGLPVRSTQQTYPHADGEPSAEAWASGGLYAAVPALALVLTAVGLIFGCTWCYRHKDCKLFTASATQLHDARRPPDSGFSEPANNNISEDNNNGPISLREMQNIANNNAAAYIVSENEERNRVSRESVVEFEPLPSAIRVADPLERCADWFGAEDFPRNRLQYLREIGRGWFGRVVEGEIEDEGTSPVAVKILNQNASLEDKARFLDEARVYRDVTHENVLTFVGRCLQEDPWILMFELCSMDLQQYLIANRPKMAILNESGVPLQLMCDVASALTYLHSRGYLYGILNSNNILVRDAGGEHPRAVLGSYASTSHAEHDYLPPETRRHPPVHTSSSEVWALGSVSWCVCAWGAAPPPQPPPPDLPCPYRNHLYQVMQLCWNPDAESRPTAAQVYALLNHLHTTHARRTPHDDAHNTHFEERWQRLKPNSIPKVDEHIALVHAPSTSMASHFTGSEEFDNPPTTQDTLSVDMDTAVSRSSSIMSDKDISIQIKSESLTNLHGSLEDVRNIYLTHNETAALECHQGNISFEDSREREQDKSDSSVDPWIKDLIAGSQDDVSYYKDVSDVIKNLDNILNSEKTSSSESSHQASPSRDNLSLDCKKDYPVQSSLVKSPGITNFKNILEMGFETKDEQTCEDDEVDKDTIGTLSHSFERHSDTMSQHTLENLTPDTPLKDTDEFGTIEEELEAKTTTEISRTPEVKEEIVPSKIKSEVKKENRITSEVAVESLKENTELPKQKIDSSDSKLPKLQDLSVVSLCSVSDNKQLHVREDCVTPCDSKVDERRTQVKPKSVDNIVQSKEINEEKPVANVISIEEKVCEKQIDTAQNQESSHDKLIEGVAVQKVKEINAEKKLDEEILPEVVTDIAINLVENEVLHPAIDIVSRMVEYQVENKVQEESSPKVDLIVENIHNTDSETLPLNSCLKQATMALLEEERKLSNESPSEPSLNVERVHEMKIEKSSSLDNQDAPPMPTKPEPVQIVNDKDTVTETETEKAETAISLDSDKTAILPRQVQNIEPVVNNIDDEKSNEEVSTINAEEFTGIVETIQRDSLRSDNIAIEQSDDSTAYMDLINYTNSEGITSEILHEDVKDVIQSCLINTTESGSLIKNESTVYLDLPTVKTNANEILESERVSSQNDEKFCASTPKGSECSADNTLEASTKTDVDLSETKVAKESASEGKTEQRYIQELLSPFESPTKSHPTDTYDENSSVVLGPFENCTMEYKGFKTEVDLPKEELLAFSSNFSEMNLETPSPLRDGNFLNEVPDITPEDLPDDLTISEVKKDQTENTDETDQSGTAKHVSPSTPPNSPGIYLASTSQSKYLVDIDFELPEPVYPPIESVQSDSGLSSLQKDIDFNQIELQITTKLAMAENENNMNIEYSGPLTVEGIVSEDEAILRESDAIPETFLAGNGGSLDDQSEPITLDEECVKALRNELELKLPLAQVCGIEPSLDLDPSEPECEVGWAPLPAPELVLQYAGGALSPILEETGHQLHAYENDHWTTSALTSSSESYPEPCNESTAEVTDLPSPRHTNTHTHSHSHSALSPPHTQHTYTVHRDATTTNEITMSADSLNGSPYKKPEPRSPIDDRTYNKDDEKPSNCERISQVSPFLMSPTTETSAPESANTTGVSTLSKTTVPTDAKHSKPSECLSKATSIDSWCSNDTLYNVEENFDDLMDPDVTFENDRELVKSASTVTLTHNDDEKEHSHCSTYIVHDSKSEQCDTFSPDSITANENLTYTKVKTEVTVPSVPTTERNESKNTTKDLAYGTLPSYSNCTTEVVSSIDDPWKVPLPELVRRSPIEEVTFTPPRVVEEKEVTINDSPQVNTAFVGRMDSVEITCLQDDVTYPNQNAESTFLIDLGDSPSEMVPSRFSTPVVSQENDENVEPIPMQLPSDLTPDLMSIPTFQTFVESAERKPQDISPSTEQKTEDTALLLEAESNTHSGTSKDDTSPRMMSISFSDFESSALRKPQEVHSNSSHTDTTEFSQFENAAAECAQDLSPLMDTNVAHNEIRPNESTVEVINFEHASHSPVDMAHGNTCLPNNANSTESHIPNITFSMYITDLDEEETDQPHSFIITEVPLVKDPTDDPNLPKDVKDDKVASGNSQNHAEEIKDSPNKTFDSHTEMTNKNLTFDSHSTSPVAVENKAAEPKINGISEVKSEESITKTFKAEVETVSPVKVNKEKNLPNGEPTEAKEVITCNGNGQNYATVNFISETFEELVESNVDDKETIENVEAPNVAMEIETPEVNNETSAQSDKLVNGVDKVAVTVDFLQNEKKFCTLDSYLPMLSDIRFTGPATEIMSTSFTQDSPTEPNSPECEQDNKQDVQDIVKEWDSDSESHSSNSSSGEFIWKQQKGEPTRHSEGGDAGGSASADGGPGSGAGSSGSGSGSEGDEVEFVPSSWDCRAAPAKSSLRSLEQPPHTDSKKRVVFKRQKYHCVYEYPRELAEVETHSPAYLPDLSTYCEWDPTSAEEAELGYGQLYGAPLDMFPLRAGIAFGTDYDEDFFISSSARPFESLGLMSSSSQFFPGMHVKPLLERDIRDVTDEYPPPPSPLTTLPNTRTPSLDFTTPDSGVEDITPGSTSTDEDFKTKKLPESEVSQVWKPVDSGSSSESVSPSSPGGEALGGLRHTRDKLKLDLPPSPHIPSPRHNRVFNFVLDKPKRHRVPDEKPAEIGTTPLVMTDETPIITTTLPLQKDEDVVAPEPTFSTFGKCKSNADSDSEQKIVLTDEIEEESPTVSPSSEVKPESPVKVEGKGEGTVLDSGDEDSGIESSSKATLERKANVS